jgi:transposase, IS5 family
MYRKQGQSAISAENFELSSEGRLSEDNRWVIMASFIPWQEFEEDYSSFFSVEIGAPAKPFRMA